MASALSFFMTAEDEKAFLRALEARQLEVYPEAFDASYKPFVASEENASLFVAEGYYLHMPAAGELVAHPLRRGPKSGMLEIDEVRSPVIYYARSLEEEGELRSGRVWSELETMGDKTRRQFKSTLLRHTFEDMRAYFKKRFVRSEPAGFFIGPIAARKAKEGLVLREAGRKGVVVKPYR
ncbi:MAG: hypothetical protein ACOX6T_10195 [Myxococcales bacterium]|jgi:hypothetical protein